jgi:hypothetical protein
MNFLILIWAMNAERKMISRFDQGKVLIKFPFDPYPTLTVAGLNIGYHRYW